MLNTFETPVHRNHLAPKKQSITSRDVVRYPGPGAAQAPRGVCSVRQAANPDTLKKITALENELLKLRAQIAMIVTAAPDSGTHCTSSHHIMKQMLQFMM